MTGPPGSAEPGGPALLTAPHAAIRCLVQSVAAQPGLAEAIPPAGLLAAEEFARFSAFRILKRRRDWLLGRWTAKHLLQNFLAGGGAQTPLREIIIRADDDGAPYAIVRGERLPVSLSISHSGDYAFCALTAATAATALPGATVGADVETIEPREPALAEQFFTEAELSAVRALDGDARDRLTTVIWSAKEAVLKALRLGLRVDTRLLECALQDGPKAEGWLPISVTSLGLEITSPCTAWWHMGPDCVLTLAFLPTS